VLTSDVPQFTIVSEDSSAVLIPEVLLSVNHGLEVRIARIGATLFQQFTNCDDVYWVC
jgi:hypothetical protein